MALIEINRWPSKSELNWFGIVVFAFLTLLGFLLYQFAGTPRLGASLGIVAVIFVIIYYSVAPVRRPAYLAWMRAISPLGWLMTHLVFGLIYYVIITPIGLARRLLGRDTLERKRRPGEHSYWRTHRTGDDPARYFRQY